MPEENSYADLKKLLVENLADTKILKEEMVKIRFYMRWRMIMTVVWIILIALPAVVAVFYVPDLLRDFSASANLIRTLGL